MSVATKNQKKIAEKFDFQRVYTLKEGLEVVKASSTSTKYDPSVDIAIRLGVNPQKADQMVRGVVSLPHGLGKERRILVICPAEKEKEALDAGATFAGRSYLEKIAGGWLGGPESGQIDIVVATPDMMAEVGKLGRILGPKGLMPNPKDQTVSLDLGKTIRELKAGKVSFKVEKAGIVHASIGRVSFPIDRLYENAEALLGALVRLKPTTAKGIYMQSLSVSSTHGRGVSVQWKNS